MWVLTPSTLGPCGSLATWSRSGCSSPSSHMKETKVRNWPTGSSGSRMKFAPELDAKNSTLPSWEGRKIRGVAEEFFGEGEILLTSKISWLSRRERSAKPKILRPLPQRGEGDEELRQRFRENASCSSVPIPKFATSRYRL